MNAFDRRTARSRGRLLLVAALAAAVQLAFAQDKEILADLKQADAELNAAYADLLHRLRPAQQAQLRVAERAWIAFTEKNNAALKGVAQKRNFSLDDRRSQGLAEIRGRKNQLEGMLNAPEESAKELAADLESADAALNFTFEQCADALGEEDIALLREAQRAWLAFRDADAEVAASAGAKAGGLDSRVRSTVDRTAQLKTIYLAVPKTPVAEGPGPTAGGKSQTPNPFERAK